MTTTAIAIQQFHDEFIVAYQQQERLAGTTLKVSNVVGDAYKWPTIGSADMTDRGDYSSPLPRTPLVKGRIVTTFAEKCIRFALGRDEKALTNVDERNIWGMEQAAAVGRYKDSLKIAVLNAVTTNVVPVGTSNLSLEKILAAKKALINANAPLGSTVNFALHGNQWEALMKLEQFTNSEYYTRTLTDGKIQGFLGMNWILFGDSTVGGLPISGNNRSCFMWLNTAVGVANKYDINPHVWYDDNTVSWISDALTEEGASVLNQNGVVKILCDETK